MILISAVEPLLQLTLLPNYFGALIRSGEEMFEELLYPDNPGGLPLAPSGSVGVRRSCGPKLLLNAPVTPYGP